MEKFRVWLILLVISMSTYSLSLRYGFSQDDFFHITISHISSIGDFLQWFIPHPDSWVFFRPISTQLWYWLFTTIFGVTYAPLPLHLAMIVIHSFNGYLIYRLLSHSFHFGQRRALALSCLYVVAGFHFLSLYYIGATQELLATLFSLLAIFATLDKKHLRAILLFILALLSKELAIRLAPFLFFLYLYRGLKPIQAIKESRYIIATSALYLVIRTAFGLVTPPEYALVLSPLVTFATTMWYALFTFGAPEYLLHYGLSGGRIDLLKFTSDFVPLGAINIAAVSASFILFVFALRKKRVISTLGMWVSGIAPVILLPTHRYAHYLDISLIPILLILAATKKKYLLIFLCVMLMSYLTGHALDYRTHWTISRSVAASRYYLKITGSGACDADKLLFVGDGDAPKELSYALMNENGPRVMCNNPDLEVKYLQSDEVVGADDSPGKEVIIKINE